MDRQKFLNQVRRLRGESKSIRVIAAELGAHRSRVHRALRELAKATPEGTKSLTRLPEIVFVGRQREMGGLVAALEDATSGRGRLVMMVGEPGIGKTRTAQELATIADQQGAKVIWGRCHEGGGAPPYWPWIQSIRSYVRSVDSERLAAEMGHGASDIAEILPELRQKLTGLSASPSLEPEQARFRLFDSIVRFLSSAAEGQPLVLILDNLQWADVPSLLLLEFLAAELDGISLLVVGTYRDAELARGHPLARTLGELTREPTSGAFQRVHLRGLTHDEVAKYIELASQSELHSEIVDSIYAQSEGNPLFVAEMVRLLREQEGDWSGRLPQGIREVIGRRLDRLSDECNGALTVAAVIGRSFGLDQLSAVVEGISGDALLRALEEALPLGVIEEVEAGVSSYQFSHALIQQTLADELSTTRRAMLHARVAEALEVLYGPDVELHSVELAHHFGRAQEVVGPTKLVRYSLLAGERALATHAWEDALAHFERARAAKSASTGSARAVDQEDAELLFATGRAQVVMGRMGEALNSLTRAFEYYEKTGDVDRAVAVAEYPIMHSHLVTAMQINSVTSMGQLVSRALKLVPPDSHQAARLLCGHLYALGTPPQNDYKGSREALSRALTIAQRDKDTALEARALARAGTLDLRHLRWQESVDKALRVVELARDLDDPLSEWEARFTAAVILRVLGDPEGARVHAETCLALAERLRLRQNLTAALAANAFLVWAEGDWEGTRDFVDRGLALQPRMTDLLHERALLEYEVGDFDQADAFLERFLEHTRQSDVPRVQSLIPLTIALAARITNVTDRFDVARQAAETVLLASPNAVTISTLEARLGLALMAVQQDDSEAAAEQYAALESVHHMTPGIHADRLLGLLAQTMGRLDEAAAHFEDVLAFCRKARYRPELAWTCHDYAALRRAQGQTERALMLLEEALAISTEFGMRPLTERVVGLNEAIEAQPGKAPAYPDSLTEREVEVLRLIAAGNSNREIANDLVLSVRTVERHITNVYGKIRARGRADATLYALAHGLTSNH